MMNIGLASTRSPYTESMRRYRSLHDGLCRGLAHAQRPGPGTRFLHDGVTPGSSNCITSGCRDHVPERGATSGPSHYMAGGCWDKFPVRGVVSGDETRLLHGWLWWDIVTACRAGVGTRSLHAGWRRDHVSTHWVASGFSPYE